MIKYFTMPTQQIILRILLPIVVFATLGAHVCTLVGAVEGALLSAVLTCIVSNFDFTAMSQNLLPSIYLGAFTGIVSGFISFAVAAALLKPKVRLPQAFRFTSANAIVISIIGAGLGAISGALFGLSLQVVFPSASFTKTLSLRVTDEWFTWVGGYFFGAIIGFAVGAFVGAIIGSRKSQR